MVDEKLRYCVWAIHEYGVELNQGVVSRFELFSSLLKLDQAVPVSVLKSAQAAVGVIPTKHNIV